jgi:hypothetical protein
MVEKMACKVAMWTRKREEVGRIKEAMIRS